MIYQLDIIDPTKTPVSWLSRVEAFRAPCSFKFKPGINVLWGRNGSGKTSLTKVLARLFHCEQGSQPCVTRESLAELIDPIEGIVKDGVRVTHDGQGVRHFDPSHAVGLMAGGAAFDWEFGTEGIANAMYKGSAGQTTMFRFDRLIHEIVEGAVPKVEWKISRDSLNSTWEKKAKLATTFLKANAEKGQPTILLDEPERSYDLNAQVGVWRFLRAFADQVQFIVASHSLFALRIPGAHYVELSPRYLASSEGVLKILQGWPMERPTKPTKPSRTDAARSQAPSSGRKSGRKKAT